jgi:hypothetical protein
MHVRERRCFTPDILGRKQFCFLRIFNCYIRSFVCLIFLPVFGVVSLIRSLPGQPQVMLSYHPALPKVEKTAHFELILTE